MLSFDQIRKDVSERQFSTVPFPLSREKIGTAVDSFLAFLKLPEEVKSSYFFKLNEEDRRANVGYRGRSQGAGDDEKEYFHYTEHGRERFVPQEDITRKFFEETGKVYDAAKGTLKGIIRVFDGKFPGTYQRFFPDGALPRLYLRMLKYSPSGEGNQLAKGHIDGGGCTLAISESSPGLRIGRNELDLSPVVHKDRTALFFPSKTFSAITSDEFKPSWHDVVKMPGQLYSKDVARWAVVFFADYSGSKIASFEDTHKPGY